MSGSITGTTLHDELLIEEEFDGVGGLCVGGADPGQAPLTFQCVNPAHQPAPTGCHRRAAGASWEDKLLKREKQRVSGVEWWRGGGDPHVGIMLPQQGTFQNIDPSLQSNPNSLDLSV